MQLATGRRLLATQGQQRAPVSPARKARPGSVCPNKCIKHPDRTVEEGITALGDTWDIPPGLQGLRSWLDMV